jgi:periplasmic copper chaperone A
MPSTLPRPLHRSLPGLVLLAFVCAAARAAGPSAVTVSDPYARAVPPGQPNSAVFMTLTNDSGAPHALIAAQSPAAKTVELHTHVKDGGMLKMRKIERIEVPAHGSVTLKPGALHVMLIGLNGPLVPGGEVNLTLSFDDGAQTQVKAPVRVIQTTPTPPMPAKPMNQ